MANARETIHIEAHNRWDALDLTRQLQARDWYLVERGPARWDVCLRLADRPRATSELLEIARAWARRRRTDTVVHLPDGDLKLHEPPPAV